MKSFKLSILTMVILGLSSMAYSAQQPTRESCDDIHNSVGESFARSVKEILPEKDPETGEVSSVGLAVEKSGASNINQGLDAKGNTIIDDISFNQKTEDFEWDVTGVTAMMKNMATKMATQARQAMLNAANHMKNEMARQAGRLYDQKVSELAKKAGFSGPVVSTALSGIGGEYAKQIANCSQLDGCMDKAINGAYKKMVVNGSKVDQSINSSINNVINSQINNGMSTIKNKVYDTKSEINKGMTGNQYVDKVIGSGIKAGLNSGVNSAQKATHEAQRHIKDGVTSITDFGTK